MYVQRVTAQSIAVGGTGSTAASLITVPSNFTPAAGCIYDIMLDTQIPAGTAGTVISITNGTDTADVMQVRNGNYARARCLECVKSFRVQYFEDPAHYNLLSVRR